MLRRFAEVGIGIAGIRRAEKGGNGLEDLGEEDVVKDGSFPFSFVLGEGIYWLDVGIKIRKVKL